MKTFGSAWPHLTAVVLTVITPAVLAQLIWPSSVFAQGTCSDTAVCSTGAFCSGFEEGNKAIWDDYDGNPDSTNLLMADPGPCNKSGNHVMRLRVPAGRGSSDLIKVLPASYDKLYARWYERWEPGYDFSVPNHGGGLFAGDRNLLGQSGSRPTGADWFTAWFEPVSGWPTLNGRPHLYTYYRGMYQDCSDPNANCYGDTLPCMYDNGSGYCTNAQDRPTVMPPTLQADRWYCVEMMMDGGTPVTDPALADGVQNFWVDGVEYGPWTKRWHRTTPNLKINILWLNLFFHGDHPLVGVMMDDVVVSTSRIGCHGSATAPRGPTNLRIIR